MYFTDDSMLPENQQPLIITVAPYGPQWLPSDYRKTYRSPGRSKLKRRWTITTPAHALHEVERIAATDRENPKCG